MSNFTSKTVSLYTYLRGFLPERLPTGMTAFDAFADAIYSTYPLPTSKQRDVRWMIATIIVNSKQQMRYRSKWFFVRQIRAASVKEVAAAVMMAAQEESRQERIKASQAAEATVSQQGAAADAAGKKEVLPN